MKSIKELEIMIAELQEAMDRENNPEILQYLEDEMSVLEVHLDDAKNAVLFLSAMTR